MRTRTLVTVAAGLLLVVGVLGTRGGTAAGEEDLVPQAASSTVPSPAEPDVPREVLLEANGLEGARLGSSGDGLEKAFAGTSGVTADDLPGGCMPAWLPPFGGAGHLWDTTAWIVDDVVSAVVLTSWDPGSVVVPGLATWLGPTLGSPLEAAQELPGARTTVERPFGPTGPAVTVVFVPLDDVEVVYSDAGSEPAGAGDDAPGRITTVEVRHPRARSCSAEALMAATSRIAPEDLPVADVGVDGLASAPFGTGVDVVRSLPGMEPEGEATDGCEAFSSPTADGYLRLVTADGVVVSVSVTGEVTGDLPVRSGGTAAEVAAALPQVTEAQLTEDGVAEVLMGDRVLRVEMGPDQRWVPDVDRPVTGGPWVVSTVTVRDATVEPARMGC